MKNANIAIHGIGAFVGIGLVVPAIAAAVAIPIIPGLLTVMGALGIVLAVHHGRKLAKMAK